MKFQVSLKQTIQQWEGEKISRFTTVIRHGSMSAEYDATVKTDRQTPLKQDELCIIVSGAGIFTAIKTISLQNR